MCSEMFHSACRMSTDEKDGVVSESIPFISDFLQECGFVL